MNKLLFFTCLSITFTTYSVQCSASENNENVTCTTEAPVLGSQGEYAYKRECFSCNHTSFFTDRENDIYINDETIRTSKKECNKCSQRVFYYGDSIHKDGVITVHHNSKKETHPYILEEGICVYNTTKIPFVEIGDKKYHCQGYQPFLASEEECKKCAEFRVMYQGKCVLKEQAPNKNTLPSINVKEIKTMEQKNNNLPSITASVKENKQAEVSSPQVKQLNSPDLPKIQEEMIFDDMKTDTKYYEDGSIRSIHKENAKYRKQQKGGKASDISYYKNGNIEKKRNLFSDEEEYFEEGRKVHAHFHLSEEIEYYENGGIKSIRKDNGKSGRKEVQFSYIFYDENGNIESENYNNMGIREQKRYYKNGQLQKYSRTNELTDTEETIEYYDNGLLREKKKSSYKIVNNVRTETILYREEYGYKIDYNQEDYHGKMTDKIQKKSVFDGKVETVISYFDNGNIQAIDTFDDINLDGEIKLLNYREFTADGKEYSFTFNKNESFESCTHYGSLGGEHSYNTYCRPYKKYLDGTLVSTMDKKQVYKEYYPNGKLKLECDKVYKEGSDYYGSLNQSCTEYIYEGNGAVKKEERTYILSSWIV